MDLHNENRPILFSGMRPTGDLHLGHWLGVLKNWVFYQEKYRCIFMIADWHAMMSEYKDPKIVKEFVLKNLAMWIAVGVDPKKSVLFLQSDVAEHLELYFVFSTLTPLSWLERCPTYKDQLKELKNKEIRTHAFLGYPLLQAADIALYRSSYVPVGTDQLPHLELTREIIRRFHHTLKCSIFPEPQHLIKETTGRILGTDGRKMSKSYKNDIPLRASAEEIQKKVQKITTDTKRVYLTDSGNPDNCRVFDYHKIFNSKSEKEIRNWCVGAKKGCRDCKVFLSDSLDDELVSVRKKYFALMDDKNYLESILKKGSELAQKRAQETLFQLRDVLEMKKAL